MNEILFRIKRVWVPIVIGLFLIIYVAIGIRYYQQGSEQTELEDEIFQVSRIAIQSKESAKELEDKVELIRSIIPASDLKETDVYQLILTIAEQAGVLPDGDVKINFRTEGQKKIGSGTYKTLSFSLTANGSYNAIRQFVEVLDHESTDLATTVLDEEQSKLATLVLSNLIITIGETTATAFDFMVYAHTAG
ncbi:hypothetical protein ACFLTS_04415 [Chloroflexota bacterium]